VIKNSPTDFATTLNQRPVSSKQETTAKSIPPTKTKRDERRRANHNEIERRRRDKINNWITQLNSRIPETFIDSNRMLGSGATDNLSKGGILAKACEYITYLEDLAKGQTDAKLVVENEALKKENAKLKQLLSEHGIKEDT
jgi:upstream stimulatory factor